MRKRKGEEHKRESASDDHIIGVLWHGQTRTGFRRGPSRLSQPPLFDTLAKAS